MMTGKDTVIKSFKDEKTGAFLEVALTDGGDPKIRVHGQYLDMREDDCPLYLKPVDVTYDLLVSGAVAYTMDIFDMYKDLSEINGELYE